MAQKDYSHLSNIELINLHACEVVNDAEGFGAGENGSSLELPLVVEELLRRMA